VKTPATTQERTIPAVTKQVTRRVVDGAPRIERRVIPARYDNVSVQRVVRPETTETVVIPAQYGTITKRTLVTPEKAEWRRILCEANASPEVVRAIQSALKQQGYYSGVIDGRLGTQTYASVKAFQTARGLSTGGLTLTTVDALGVDWRSMVSGNQFGTTTGGFGATGGTSGGFTSGTTVSAGGASGGAAGYTIGSDGSVRNAAGAIIGRMTANGDVVNSAGQVVLRGLSAAGGAAGGSVGGLSTGGLSDPLGGITGGASGGSILSGATVGADGTVRNSSGSIIGRVNANGEVVANGVVIGRVR